LLPAGKLLDPLPGDVGICCRQLGWGSSEFCLTVVPDVIASSMCYQGPGSGVCVRHHAWWLQPVVCRTWSAGP
jgi:hypothetical protein